MEYRYKAGNSLKFEQIEGTTLVKVFENNNFIGNVGIGSLFHFAKGEIKKEGEKFSNLF